MVDWSDSFWGEGNRGFDVLSSNMKNGAIAIDEFQKFLAESVQCESAYQKNFSRVQALFLKSPNVGTYSPIWNLMRYLLDRVSAVHLSTVNFYQDLLRDIHNYQELYQKKVKVQIQKDGDINRTPDLITQFNNSLATVNKAKEQYHSIALEYDRAKRTGNNSSNPSSFSTGQENNPVSLASSTFSSLTSRGIDRLERKYRQAQDEYKLTIEKYNLVRNDYEKRFSDASTKFQAFEIDHIEKMLAFSLTYAEIIQRNNEQISAAQKEFTDKLKGLTGNALLNYFVEQKQTGIDRPAVLQFEEGNNLRTSVPLTSELPTGQEEMNTHNPQEFNVPSFQAHFSVPSPSTKQADNSRALLTHPQSNDPDISSANNTPTPLTSTPSDSSATRTQEGNEQPVNPFDLPIKRSKIPEFFRSKRVPKDKQSDKTVSTGSKSRRIPHIRRPRTSTGGDNGQKNNLPTGDVKSTTENNSDYLETATKKVSNRSSSSFSNDDNARQHPFPSSKSSSSSDTSDDDDPMTKINFKIKESTTQVLPDENDEARITNAMRMVDLNIGNFAPLSRGLSSRTTEINQSSSSGQDGAWVLPPFIPTRPNVTTIDRSAMFPPQDHFAQTSFNPVNITLTRPENRSASSQSRSESKNTTSLSSNEDDPEVASSFPNSGLINNTTPFPILQVPRLYQSNQQLLTNSAINPSIVTTNQSISNSPVVSNEFGVSSLTIGAFDQVPLAIAFQETIHVMMSGDNQEKWKSRINGQMLISFPSSMLNLLGDSSRSPNPLEFRVKNLANIENIVAKPSLIIQNASSTDSDELIYSFDMAELNNTLRSLHEKNSTSLFFNLNVLNYQLEHFETSNIPVEIYTQWTRTSDTIAVNIKYHFNSSALPDSIRFTNNSVIIYTIITDGEKLKESLPMAEWSETEHKLSWKVPYVINEMGNLAGSVTTMLTNASDNADNEEPWSTSSAVKVNFIGENALFSSIDFDLTSRGYRISLLKKKILSGKYQSEPDQSEPINFFKRPTKSPVLESSLSNPSGI